MTDPAQRRTLDTIEQQIASRRFDYLHATWEAQNASDAMDRELAAARAKLAEDEVNDMLAEWDDTRRGKKAAT